jgi:hypothetical protein
MHFKGLHKYKTAAKLQLNLFLLSGVMHMNVWDLGPDQDLKDFDPCLEKSLISSEKRYSSGSITLQTFNILQVLSVRKEMG